MNLTPSEVEQFFSEWSELFSSGGTPADSSVSSSKSSAARWQDALVQKRVIVALAPAMLAVDRATQSAKRLSIPLSLGSQNVHWEPKGAFTGESSVGMAKDLGLQFSLVGHSERRQWFGESHDSIHRKLKALLDAGLVPLLCVGETLAERDAGQTAEVLASQLRGALGERSGSVAAGLDGRIVIAYEPVWAIGTGENATPDQAQEVHLFIRNWLKTHFSPAFSEKTRILYGGSVKPENSASLMKKPDVDGFLVGGASLEANSFSGIVEKGLKSRS